jgi:hypothetical protein
MVEEQKFNFNDPVEVLEICKVFENEFTFKELGSRFAFLWEDITSIKEYPFDDPWETFTGEKCFVKVRFSEEEYLLQESYDYLIEKWKQYRNIYLDRF